MYHSIELETQLHRDRQLEQAEKYRLIRMVQVSRSDGQKSVSANIREKLTSLDLWLKAGRAALQVS